MTGGTLTNTDTPDEWLDVRRDASTVATDKPAGLLLLHHLNANGSRAQVVPVKVKTSVKLTASSTSYTYGGKPVLTATVSPSSATGTVAFKDGSKVLKTVAVSGGKATYTVSGQARGTHSMTAVFTGSGDFLSSTSSVVKVTVKGVASTTKLAANDRDFSHGYRPTLTATVTSTATGTVTFRDGSKVLGTATISKGKAVLKAPVLSGERTRSRPRTTARASTTRRRPRRCPSACADPLRATDLWARPPGRGPEPSQASTSGQSCSRITGWRGPG